jgi:hypothetical protein
MADFLKNPESVQAVLQNAAQGSKGKIGDAVGQARHADSLELNDEALWNQLKTVKIQTDQMTASLAAIATQVASETDAEMAAEYTEKAEKIEAAYEFMGDVVSCFTDPDPKAIGGKLKDFAVKYGFKLLAKADTQEIRKRAADLKKLADEKHKDALSKASDALITALSKFDELAPAMEKQLSESAERFESQIKQAGEKFDTVCEKSDFHFYDVESAVKDAQKALDAAASAREALEENAVGLPEAIGRAVLRTNVHFGAMEGAMENAVKRVNGPTIDTARDEVERKIKDWKTREQKLGESLDQLLQVRKKGLQALADFGG